MARRSMMERIVSETDQEIELYSNAKERQAYDDQANLYAIIMATEHLERAYARDDLTKEEYTTECNKLISQFRLAEKAAIGGKNMTTQ
jgi:ESCRT-I complex subunit VPS28